jgi:hypothetical protein
MSKIVIFVYGRVTPTALMTLKRITELSLSEIRHKILTELPLAEYHLFNNNHDEIDRILRELIDTCDRHSIEADFFEVRENENILEIENKYIFQVSPKIVLNILDAADRELLRQMDELRIWY